MAHQNIAIISPKTAKAVRITIQHQMPKDAAPYSVEATVEAVRCTDQPGEAGIYVMLLAVYNPAGNLVDAYDVRFSAGVRASLLNAVLDEYLRQASAENTKRRNVAAYAALSQRAAVNS